MMEKIQQWVGAGALVIAGLLAIGMISWSDLANLKDRSPVAQRFQRYEAQASAATAPPTTQPAVVQETPNTTAAPKPQPTTTVKPKAATVALGGTDLGCSAKPGADIAAWDKYVTDAARDGDQVNWDVLKKLVCS